MGEFKPKEVDKVPHSEVKSGTVRKEVVEYCGGEAPKKHVDEIDKVNSPDARKRAPGSVGF